MADYYNAVNETQLLAGLSTPATAWESALLRGAVVAARAREAETLLAAVSAQHDLAGISLIPESGGLPLTSDTPLAGKYQTRFETLFAGRAAPSDLRQINATLPLYLNLVDARAESVHAADQALSAAIDAYRSGQIGISTVVEAQVRLRDERIALLAVVRDYNHAIADYALNAAGAGISREEAVSMLIETAKPSNSTASPQAPTTPVGNSPPQTTPSGNGVPANDRLATHPTMSSSAPNPVAVTPNLVPVKPAPTLVPATPGPSSLDAQPAANLGVSPQ
jgi:hypothetical protein